MASAGGRQQEINGRSRRDTSRAPGIFSSHYVIFTIRHLRDYPCEWRTTGEAKKGDGYGAQDKMSQTCLQPQVTGIFFSSRYVILLY
jgi:hypothetical protein